MNFGSVLLKQAAHHPLSHSRDHSNRNGSRNKLGSPTRTTGDLADKEEIIKEISSLKQAA
jgi:hypothetical protein